MGWPLHPPRSSDHDSSKNNIFVETRFSDILKFNDPGEDYEKLQAYLKSIDVPKKIYDRDAPAPSALVRTVKVKDDDNGEAGVGLTWLRKTAEEEDALDAAFNEASEAEDEDRGDVGDRKDSATNNIDSEPLHQTDLHHEEACHKSGM